MELNFFSDIFSDISIVRNVSIDNLGLVDSGHDNQLTFLALKKYLPRLLENKNIVAVIATPELVESIPEHMGLCVSADPSKSFVDMHNYLSKKTDFYRIPFDSRIHPEAMIHPKAFIAEKNVVISQGVIVEAGAYIFENTFIGKDSHIYNNAIIGNEDTHVFKREKRYFNLCHAGGVFIGERTCIKYGAMIGRAVFKANTYIGNDVIIDKLSSVSHACYINDRTQVTAHVDISGYCKIGEDVYIGPSSVISHEVTIGDRARITLGSVVVQNVKADEHVTGHFALPHKDFLAGKRLPRIRVSS